VSDKEAAEFMRAKESGDLRSLPAAELDEIPPHERFACRACGRQERFDRMTMREGVLLCGDCK
jgi:hypothetical protein